MQASLTAVLTAGALGPATSHSKLNRDKGWRATAIRNEAGTSFGREHAQAHKVATPVNCKQGVHVGRASNRQSAEFASMPNSRILSQPNPSRPVNI